MLADLDTLCQRCRSEAGRQLFGEALATYRVGAYRATIVLLWTAIVHDYIAKLHELVLDGNGAAKAALEQFDRARQNVPDAQAFEAGLIAQARTEFELLSILEADDLERLRMDRHRCAHPAVHSLTEPYTPNEELARLHLRNSAEHMLIRPPVQGRSALERVFADIGSKLFPVTVEEARRALESGPLGRAKDALINDAFIGIMKDLVLKERPDDERARQLAALVAISRMYPEHARGSLERKLANLVARADENAFPRVLIILGALEEAWRYLSETNREAARRFVKMLADDDVATSTALIAGLRIDQLRDVAMARTLALPVEPLVAIVEEYPTEELIASCCERLERTRSFNDIRDLRFCLVPLSATMPTPLYRRLVAALTANRAIKNYMGWGGFVRSLLDASVARAPDATDQWIAVHAEAAGADKKRIAQALAGVFPEPVDDEFAEVDDDDDG